MAPLWSGLRLLVVLGLVLSTQSLLLIQGAFSLRQDEIAERLCVNRERPEMECDGHCVLRERFGDHHEHEDTTGKEALALALSVVPFVEAGSPLPQPRAGGLVTVAGRGQDVGAVGHPAGVFRPPRAA